MTRLKRFGVPVDRSTTIHGWNNKAAVRLSVCNAVAKSQGNRSVNSQTQSSVSPDLRCAGETIRGVSYPEIFMVDSMHKRREELATRLQALNTVFERQMRARGFNPEQAENVALTSELADLYAACQAIRTELEELSQNPDEEG